MCYEFAHSCQTQLINEFNRLIGRNAYFLICIASLNYYYCDDIVATKRVSDLLKSDGITLHAIEDFDMLSVINEKHVTENHIFHGSIFLLNKFREKSEVS